jgi:CTP:molybdopterin cytidylyltransferase MocA
MSASPLGAIVLAAGASSRMGRPKALLPLDGGATFVERIHRTLLDAGLAPIVVVARPELEAAVRTLLPPTALVAVNESPERGQLSSLLVGLEALGRPAAALVTLVDLPLVRVETVSALIAAWARSGAPLVRPVTLGRRGHPIIVGGPVIAALAKADPHTGAKPIVHAFAAEALDVAVDDPGTLDDVDTPQDYARLSR